MNFLGHAYLARNHPHLIAGNFAGDSYKGHLENFEHLPKNILDGVRLHRFIDDYTDHSEHILAAGKILQDGNIKKVAYIATDIILDHYLAKNWSNYSSKKYTDFIQTIYQYTDPHLSILENDFNYMYPLLKEHGWINSYVSEEGIANVLRQFSKRIGFENDLDKCFKIYKSEIKTFDEHFENFLVDISASSIEFIRDL